MKWIITNIKNNLILIYFLYINPKSATTSWKLKPDKGVLGLFRVNHNIWKENNGFRYFKIQQTDYNGSGYLCLAIGGI